MGLILETWRYSQTITPIQCIFSVYWSLRNKFHLMQKLQYTYSEINSYRNWFRDNIFIAFAAEHWIFPAEKINKISADALAPRISGGLVLTTTVKHDLSFLNSVKPSDSSVSWVIIDSINCLSSSLELNLFYWCWIKNVERDGLMLSGAKPLLQ